MSQTRNSLQVKRTFLLIVLCRLLGACAHQSQLSILDSNIDVVKTAAEKSCESLHHRPMVPYVECLYGAEKDLFEKEGFEYTDLLEDRYYEILDVARKYDARELTKDESNALEIKIEKQFVYNVQRADAAEMGTYQRKQQQAAIMAYGMMDTGPTPVPKFNTPPTPVYNSPSVPNLPTNLDFGNPIDTTRQPVGAVGWDGRRYVPVDPSLNPGLTPNGFAQ